MRDETKPETTRVAHGRTSTTRRIERVIGQALSHVLVPLCVAITTGLAALPSTAQEQTSIGQVETTHGTGGLTVNEQNQTTLTSEGHVGYKWEGGINQHAEHTLEFNQSGDDASATNYGGGQNAFEFFGTVKSNGQVIFANEAGVFFQDGSSVIVGDLIAAAGNLSESSFGSDHKLFYGIDGEVINRGTIVADNVALLGDRVANHGEIYVPDGQLLMLAGDTILLREHLSPIVVRVPLEEQRFGDSPETTAVENTGVLDAGANGRVRLAAADGLAYAIRNRVVERLAQSAGEAPPASGVIRAGTIEIEGGDESLIEIGGTLDATREGKRAVGGQIDVFGDAILIDDDAVVDASGSEGGGSIRIGGDTKGQGDVRRAKVAFVSETARIRADATYAGDGGSVVVWSDGPTFVRGLITARGGEYGGQGGFVETSGAVLDVTRAADVSARAGRVVDQGGEWLLDPYNVIIGDFEFDDCDTDPRCLDKGIDLQDILFLTNPVLFTTAEPSLLNASVLEEALTDGSSIFVTTSSGLQGVGDSLGNIIVRENILPGIGADENTSVVLRMSAANHIVIEEDVQIGGNTGLDGEFRDDYLNLNLGVQLIANDAGGQEESPTEFGEIPNEFIGDIIVKGDIYTNRSDLVLQGTNIELRDTSNVGTGGGDVLIAAIGALDPDTGDLSGGGDALLEGVLDTSSNRLDERGEPGEGGAVIVQARFGDIPQQGPVVEGSDGEDTQSLGSEGSRRHRGGSILVAGEMTLGRHEIGTTALELEAIGGDIDIESAIVADGGAVSMLSTRVAEQGVGSPGSPENGGRITIANTGSITTGGGDVELEATGSFADFVLSGDYRTRIEVEGAIDTSPEDTDVDLDGLVDTIGGRVRLRAEGLSATNPSGFISIKAMPGQDEPLIRTLGGNIDLNLELDETGEVSLGGTAHANIEIEASIDAGLETGAELDIGLENAFFGAVFVEGTGSVTVTNGGTGTDAYRIRGERVAIRSANRSSLVGSGRGDLEFVSNGDGAGPEIWARDIVLQAGVESVLSAFDNLSKIVPGNVQLYGLDGPLGLEGNREIESLVYAQNASFLGDDILNPADHFLGGDPSSLDGLDYTIQSLAGSVTLDDADKFTGTTSPGVDLTVLANDDITMDDSTWGAAEMNSLRLLVNGSFEIDTDLALNASAATDDLQIVSGRRSFERADLRILDGVVLDASESLELHAAAGLDAPAGDLIFGTAEDGEGSGASIELRSKAIALQAGTGGGERVGGSGSNRVLAGPDSTTPVNFDLSLDYTEARHFSIRQEASLSDEDLPELAQFLGTLPNANEIGRVVYALRSDSGRIDLGPDAARKLARTDLALLAEDGIGVDVDLPETDEDDDPRFQVRTLDIGGIGTFEVTQQLVDQFEFAPPPYSGVSPKSMTFRSGVAVTGDLTFERRAGIDPDGDGELPVGDYETTIKADEIRLVASDGTGGNGAGGGGVGSRVIVHDLLRFQHTETTEDTTTPLEAFSIEQDATVFISINEEGIESLLPDINANFGGVAPLVYGLQSTDGAIQISLDAIPTEFDDEGDEIDPLLELPLASERTVLSAPRVVLQRLDGEDLNLATGLSAVDGETTVIEIRSLDIELIANDINLGDTDPDTGLPSDLPDAEDLAKVDVGDQTAAQDEGLFVYGFAGEELDDRTDQPVPELLDLAVQVGINDSIPVRVQISQDHTIESGDLLELSRSGSGCGFGRGPACDDPHLRTLYRLTSNHGDIHIRPDRVTGADLDLQIPLALQDDEIKSSRGIFFDPDDPDPDPFAELVFVTESFNATTAFGWQVGHADRPVLIEAADQITLRSGTSGRGDLGFLPDVTLQSEDINLEAIGPAGQAISDILLPIVDARTNAPTFDFKQPDPDRLDSNFDSFKIEQDGWVNDLWVDRPQTGGDQRTLPDPSLMVNAGDVDEDGAGAPLKLFGYTILSNRRGITIEDLQNVKSRRLLLRANVQQVYDSDFDSVDRPGVVLIDHAEAASASIDFENAFGDGDGFERVGISGDSIQLKAGPGVLGGPDGPEGYVDASGFEGGAIYLGNSADQAPPLEFVIEQDLSFEEANADYLPASFQFLSGLVGVEYTLRLRDNGAAVIEIGRDMADKLRGSSLRLEARDLVKIDVPKVLLEGLVLTDLDVYEIDGDGVLNIEIGDVIVPGPEPDFDDTLAATEDGGEPVHNATLIETAGTQRYDGEVGITGNVEFRGGDIEFTGDVLNRSTSDGGAGVDPDQSGIDFLTRGTVSFGGNVGCIAGTTGCTDLAEADWDTATSDQYAAWFDRFRVRFDADAAGRDAVAFVGDADQTVFALDAQVFAVSPSEDIANLDSEVIRVADTATFYKVDGDFDPSAPGTPSSDTLTFYTRDGFRIGEGQKIAVQGNLVVNARDRITVGDISALDISLNVAPDGSVDGPGVIEIQKRSGGNYITPDGRLLRDAGVSFVTNSMTFNVTPEITGDGQSPSLAIEDPRTVTNETLAGFTLTTIDAEGSALSLEDFEWQIEEPPPGLPAQHAFGLPRNDISTTIVGAEITPPPLPWMVDEWRVADARRLRDLAVRPRDRSIAEWTRYLEGAGIIDDIGSGTARRDGLETVAEPRLLAQDAQRSIELYEQIFGVDAIRSPAVRAVLTEALDRYQRSSGTRRVVGFEFRRYVKNRPNSLFEAYQIFEDLDQLFDHHRALGLTPGEYRPIQARWLAQIQPQGISIDELSEAVHPSRYVRGTDILEIFGD